VVSDGEYTASETISVIVNEVNVAPVLNAIGDRTVNEGSLLTFTGTAKGGEGPENTLTYSLVDEPMGAEMDPESGVFTWTPSEEQGPGEFTFTVVVSDGEYTDSETITVVVHEVNVAPVLVPIGDRMVNEGSLLTFTATATDDDVPENTLTFSLVSAPTGATIDEETGVFTWTPNEEQ